MKTKILFITIVLLFSSVQLFSQDEPECGLTKNISSIDGYLKYQKAKYELDWNGDGNKDLILLTDVSKGEEDTPCSQLIILYLDNNKNIISSEISKQLYGTFFEIELKKNIIVLYTGWMLGDATYKFRYEKSSQKTRLIGADMEYRGGQPSTHSINHLTGDRVDEESTYNEARDRMNTKKKKSKTKPIFIYLDGFSSELVE